jgi:hypothetical protein
VRTSHERLFPDEDYRFHLRMERGDPAAFFAPTPLHEQLIAERRGWLRIEPRTYAALLLPDVFVLLTKPIQKAAAVAGNEFQNRVGNGAPGLLGAEFTPGTAHVGSHPTGTDGDDDDTPRPQFVGEPDREVIQRSLRSATA